MPGAESLPRAYRVPRPTPASEAWSGPLYFCAMLGTLLLGATYEVCLRQTLAFGSGELGSGRYLGVASGLFAVPVGALMGRRLKRRAQQSLVPMCLASALCVALSSPILFLGFSLTNTTLLRVAVPVSTGLCVGASAVVAHAALGKLWRQLSLLPRLLDPLRLAATLLIALSAAALAPRLGLIRSSLLLAGLLSLTGFWYCRLFEFLERRPLLRSRSLEIASSALGVLCAAGFALSEGWVSRSQLAYFQHPVLQAHSGRSETIVTAGPVGLQFFVDRALRFADVDGYRYFEALVHPALAAHHAPRRVLVLGVGDGFASREILRHDSVELIHLIAEDRRLVRLAQTAGWLRERTADALLSPKLRLTESEPIVWLSDNHEPYDIIVVDLPDAAAPRWGKNYTRYFYRRLAAHLAPRGIAAVQGTPIFEAPRSFANIEASVQAAGLSTLAYRVAVPSIGEWGFLLASRGPLPIPSSLNLDTRYLDDTILGALFAIPVDSRAEGGPPSTLYDQRLLSLLREELTQPQ